MGNIRPNRTQSEQKSDVPAQRVVRVHNIGSCSIWTEGGGIMWWDISKYIVGMAVEKNCTKLFHEEVSKVDGCVYSSQAE